MTISATTQGLRAGVCTSTSRPSVPFDGMLIYETDTNRVAVYDTNTWVYKTPASTTGSVLQVVSTTKTDTFSSSQAQGGIVDVTGLSASITPSSTSSKIFVAASVHGVSNISTSYYGYLGLQLKRNGSAIGGGVVAGSRASLNALMIGASGGDTTGSTSFNYLDSPNTASAITYQIAVMNVISATATLIVNQMGNDANQTNYARLSSSITVMEIAG